MVHTPKTILLEPIQLYNKQILQTKQKLKKARLF